MVVGDRSVLVLYVSIQTSFTIVYFMWWVFYQLEIKHHCIDVFKQGDGFPTQVSSRMIRNSINIGPNYLTELSH